MPTQGGRSGYDFERVLEEFGAGRDPGSAMSCGLDRWAGWVHALLMPKFTANADYEERDSDPINLSAGDEVSVGPVDRAWPGWVWAEDSRGRHGYVPEKILEPLGEGRFALMEDFDPRVLAVKRGDQLESLEQIDGWHWCRNDAAAEGWVAGYLLRPIE